MLKINNLRFILGLSFFSAVACAQLRITTTGMPVATQYQSYIAPLTAAGGTPPYTWSVVSSTGISLPEGMSLNPATGVVSAAQVNGQGGYSVTVQVTDRGSPSPAVATATLNFGVNSDTSFAGCQMFPPDSIYNQRIDLLPVDSNAAHQIPASYLTKPLHPDFGHGFYPGPGGIPWMRVPANQPTTNVNLANGGQIDAPGTYAWPLPAWPDAVIEMTSYGPANFDHHILILQTSTNNISGPQTGACTLYETYQSTAVPGMFDAASNTWSMMGGVHYLLNGNEIAASTSTLDNGGQDSPGIPMVPLLLRYSEVPLGAQHPLRIAFPSPTNWFVWPGTGCCGGTGPPQGLLYRLKAGVNWAATCPVTTNPQAATVLQALQQYGAYMSDHGSAAYVGGAPDVRWDDNDLACIKKFHASDLEVVDNSALEVSAISGQTKPYVVPAALAGSTVGAAYSATFSAVGGNPATRQWSVAAGSLPVGLVLNAATGTISGLTTSSAGSPFHFTITAADTASGYTSAPQAFSVAVTGGSPTSTITIASVPPGLALTIDGTSYAAPQSFNWIQGSGHTVSVPSPQGTGTRYTFAGWSDSGAQSHTIVVPAVAAAYTANFTTQYLLTTAIAPAGAGAVAANPSSADGYYNSGTTVQLTAAPSGGHTFSGFTGDLTGAANPQSVTMSAPRAVTATFAAPPGLHIQLSHTGNFILGQTGTYTVTVSNGSLSATAGTVTVVDTVPTGMTLVSMAGTGWTCAVSSGACTRGDTLGAGAAHPVITVTAGIAANATSPIVNSATVSGGGSASAMASDSTILTPSSPPGTATAVFTRTDSGTAGSWQGAYGADGYNVIGDTASVPAYVTVTPSGNSTWVWASSTTDPRALQTPSTPGRRIAATWYAAGSFSIDLAFHDANPHQLAIYLVDWDSLGRTENITISDANNTLLDSRPAANFAGGQYLVWTVSGHVSLRIANTAGRANAVIGGLFFGAGQGPSSATFLTSDTTTAGAWTGVYGADGYDVAGSAASVPAYVTVTPSGMSSWTWAYPTSDARGLQVPSSTATRIAACWYTPGVMNIDLVFNDSNSHQLAIYLLDWDKLGRAERIDILDSNNNPLDTRMAAGFSGGQYLVWNLSGHVILRITNLGPAVNAVVGGLFFGA
jgi:uncharacterized repeat protein (TIGR01451 family)